MFTCRQVFLPGTFLCVCVFVPVVRILETGSHLLLALGIESNAESRFFGPPPPPPDEAIKDWRDYKFLFYSSLLLLLLFVGDFFFVFASFKFLNCPGDERESVL